MYTERSSFCKTKIRPYSDLKILMTDQNNSVEWSGAMIMLQKDFSN